MTAYQVTARQFHKARRQQDKGQCFTASMLFTSNRTLKLVSKH